MSNGRFVNVVSGNGHNWVYYIVYFLIAVLVAWGAVFIMLRNNLIPHGSWLYERTNWIPGLGPHSWAREQHRN